MRLALFRLGVLEPLGIPIAGYLIQTDDGKNVLIDSGFPESFIENPPGPQGPLNLQPHVRPEDHIVSRLQSIGVQPHDIDVVVCTHFDADHAGNHDLFDQADLVVQRSHYEAAKAGDGRSAVVRQHWDAPALKYRLVDGDTSLLPGIELIETSGHVLGHQSVLVRLPETGPVLLAIDAVPAQAAADPDTRPIFPNDEDEAATRRSTKKLAELAQNEGVALVVYGHDAAQWTSLRLAPEFYC
jgi:N-acyl homoserine lactone hydrolase